MPSLPVGFSDDLLMSLVHSSVAQYTWSNHSKMWVEWLDLVGDQRVAVVEEAHLEVTADYLLSLWEAVVSAVVAQHRLLGVSFLIFSCKAGVM